MFVKLDPAIKKIHWILILGLFKKFIFFKKKIEK